MQTSVWANNSQPASAGQQSHNPQGNRFVQGGQQGTTQSTGAPGWGGQVRVSVDPKDYRA
jgi:hypothetical protein